MFAPLILAALQAASPAPAPAPAPAAAPPPSPAEIVAAAPASAWADIPADALMVLELADGGRVVIRLAPDWAPVHVANLRALAAAGWWDGQAITRVQDNYVVQWGGPREGQALPAGATVPAPAEYERPAASVTGFRPLPVRDAYARQVGHAGGWPVARDGEAAWLPHCYAMVGIGRDLAPDTGDGTELYTVIGHAPRHLDRNIAVVGQIVEGIETLSSLKRGTGPLGFYTTPAERTPIARVRMAGADVPGYQYLKEDTPSFAAYAAARANRRDPFFNRPAGGADLCNIPVPIRRKP